MNEVAERPSTSVNPFADSAVAARPAHGDSAGTRQSQAREMAEMQTKYLMAQQFQRDERVAMDRILNAFSRRGLAERAQYQFSRGGTDISGPSIHAAQAIATSWGNIEMGWREVSRGLGFDGVPYSEVECYAYDLQARVPSRIGFIVRHWRDTKSGGYKLRDERDIYELCASQAQRRKRACILALIPQDVIDAAMDQAEVTLKATADTSPEAMARMVQAFAELGVSKEQIEKRIQRRIESIQPAQVVTLRRIYASLQDEMSTPADWFEMPEQPQIAQQPGQGTASAAAAVRDKLKSRQKPAAIDPADRPDVGAADTPPAGQEGAGASETGEVRATYASVATALSKASTRDELDQAALLIDAVAAPKQQAELLAIYKRQLSERFGEG